MCSQTCDNNGINLTLKNMVKERVCGSIVEEHANTVVGAGLLTEMNHGVDLTCNEKKCTDR